MSNFNYNITGEKRKELVRAMSEILGEDASYQGAPSFAYSIDGYIVSRNGLVTFPDIATHEDIDHLVDALKEKGFTPETTSEDVAPESIPKSATDTAVTDDNTFTVEMPRASFTEEAYGNLQKIIASKAALLKKAIGTDLLDIETSADKLIFPWFTLHGLDGEADAYTRLVSALYNMAKNQKRVTAKERDSGNEKFTMRLFLIRLGFIGDEYKTARKILLRNLTGNGSWKSGHAPERTANTLANTALAAEAKGSALYEN